MNNDRGSEMASQTQQTQQVQQAQQTRRQQRVSARSGDTADSRAAVNRIARAWIIGAIVAGLGIGVFIRFYGTHFERLGTTDGVNVAQVARSVAAGRGLKTSVLYPIHTAVGNPEAGRHDIAAGPLYAFGLGVFFKGRGADDRSVALFNGLLLFLTAAFLYGIIKLTFDRHTALWAVLAYFISMKAISQAFAAGGASIGALMVTAAVYFGLLAVHNADREPQAAQSEDEEPSLKTKLLGLYRSPWPWTILAGMAIGLSYLTGVVGLLALAVLGWIASRQGRRSRSALVATALVAILVVGPWVARNVKHFGTPTSTLQRYSLVMNTGQFPVGSLLWSTSELPDTPEVWALTNPGQMIRKVGRSLVGFYGQIPELQNRYLFPFVVVGLFLCVDTSRRRLLWGAFWMVLFAQVLTGSLYDGDADGIAVMTPIATGLAVATLIALMRTHLTTRKGLIAVGLLAAAIVVWPYAASSVATPPEQESPSKSTLDYMAMRIPPEVLVATDIPWQVAWWGGHSAVLLPENDAQLRQMADAGIQPHMIYLSRGLRGERVQMGREYWARLLATGEGVDDLPVIGADTFPNGEVFILLEAMQPILDEMREEAAAAAGETEAGAAADADRGDASEAENSP